MPLLLLGAVSLACGPDSGAADPDGRTGAAPGGELERIEPGAPDPAGSRSPGPHAAQAAPRERLVRVVHARPADPLLGYAWDDAAEIALGGGGVAGELSVEHGEPSPDPGSLLHLSFNEAPKAALDLSPARHEVEARGLRAQRGRFGRAVAPAASGPALLRVPDLPPLPDRWTLELWVRAPQAPAAGPLAARAGAFRLALDAGGHALATLELAGGDQVRLRSRSPLPPGVWVHLALAVDADTFHHLRLVANGELTWRKLPDAKSPGRGRGPLVLGGWTGGAPGFAGALDQVRLLARAATTHALLRSGEAPTPRGDHLLRLRFRSGERVVHAFAFPLRQRALARPADLGAGVLHLAVADGAGLRPADAHFEQVQTREAPLPRTTHPTIYAGAGQAFVFAGEVRDSHAPPMRNLPDTWLYDIAERHWSRVGGGETAPSPRCHQAAAYSPDHDLVLFVGGWRNETPDKEILSDVWVFHVRERRWQERPPRGVRLPAQSDSGVVYHAGLRRFLVFRHAEIYEYDPEADRWSRRPEPRVVDADGRPARLGGRTSPIMGYDPETQQVLRFGGSIAGARGERVYTDTTALYDAGANRWTVLRPGARPAPRVRGALAYDARRRRFVLFGGVRDQFSQRYGDLWSFEPRARRWTRHVASNPPSPRGGFYGMAYDAALDTFVLSGGRPSHRVILDETWHLRFGDGPGRASYVFDRARFEPVAGFYAITLEPGGSAVRLHFAGSEDGAAFGVPVRALDAIEPPGARFVRVEVELVRGAAPDALPRVLGLGFGSPDAHARDGGAPGAAAATVRRLAASPYPGDDR